MMSRYPVLVMSLMFSTVVLSASKTDIQAEYARSCKLTVAFDTPALVAQWKDEGVTKAEALKSLNLVPNDGLSASEREAQLLKVDHIYGRYRHLTAKEIYGILVNECVEEAIKSGGLG